MRDIRETLPGGPGGAQRLVFDLDADDPRWAEFVSAHRDALPYHHPAWFQVLREAFGYSAAALGCADSSGRLSGMLPLLEKKSLLAGLHHSSLPHTPVAGPLAVDGDSRQALLSAAASRMPNSPQQLRFGGSRNNSRIRWAVRKASRLGVTVREASSPADVRRWYELYLQTMREHAVPPRPLRMFEIMWEILAPGGLMRLLLAERQAGGRTELLAGSIFLLHGRTVVYAFNGRDRAQLAFRPNDAIHWKAITEAAANGFRRYDFGEVGGGNDGLVDFKEKWGAKPVELYRYHYPRDREIERRLLAPGGFRRTAECAWRQLPLPATATLGRWIYRCL